MRAPVTTVRRARPGLAKIVTSPGQEGFELLGMLADELARLTLRSRSGDDAADIMIEAVRQEVYSLVQDCRAERGR